MVLIFCTPQARDDQQTRQFGNFLSPARPRQKTLLLPNQKYLWLSQIYPARQLSSTDKSELLDELHLVE